MNRRRSKNEGSLFFRSKLGLWVGEITLPDGKKKTKYGKTQAEVRKWLLDNRKALQEGNYLLDDTYTVESFLARYVADVGSHTLSPRTLLSYTYLIRVHIVPEIGKIKLSQLRPDHLQSLYAKKLASGLSRRTVQKIHNFLHTALNIAYKWGLILRNPADLAEAPVAEKSIPEILNVTQINQLLEQVKGTRYYALYACAASLGLREGEIGALEWTDIDWVKHTISINKQLQYIPGMGVSVKFPKTKASVRTLPLPDIAISALEAHKVFSSSNIIFCTSKGTYFQPRNILRQFQIALKKTGLPKVSFHALRHSCASYHLAMGTNPKVVQSLLGHSSINVTLGVYSHLLPGVTEEATRNINKVFS